MVDSVNALNLTCRRIINKKVSNQLGIRMVTAQKIVLDDLAFSKVNFWVSTGHCMFSYCSNNSENH